VSVINKCCVACPASLPCMGRTLPNIALVLKFKYLYDEDAYELSLGRHGTVVVPRLCPRVRTHKEDEDVLDWTEVPGEDRATPEEVSAVFVKRCARTLAVAFVTSNIVLGAVRPRPPAYDASRARTLLDHDIDVTGARIAKACYKLKIPRGVRVDGQPEAARFWQPWETQQ